jgi:hypothetical protein
MTLSLRRFALALLGLSLTVLAVAVAAPGAPEAASSKALQGTFRLNAGSYSGGKARGTYFRMIYPGAARRYFANPDSSASNKTYTLGRAGSDGGLATGRFQPHPNPPFDKQGNARASRIIRPQPFTQITFTVATLSRDPRTKKRSAVTSARVSGRNLTVRVPGYTAEWNKQYFNQGAPKPDGSGSPATGKFNARTKHFTLSWTSKISGGPFNGFSGFWHLEGTFSPR